MVLMSPAQTGSLTDVQQFNKEWAGAEANFLVGCSRLGLSTGFISAFSRDPFGTTIHRTLAGENIDLQQSQWDDARAQPLFFKERQPNGEVAVYYYRTNTAGVSINWDAIDLNYFNNTNLFYFTSIFPALSAANAQGLRELLPQLKARNITIAFDPNIRLKLFNAATAAADAQQLVLSFLKWIDILLINHSEAQLVFNTQMPAEVFAHAAQHNISLVALKRGAQGAAASDGKSVVEHPTVAHEVIDTCGAGDAFNAGFIYGIQNSLPLAECIKAASHTAAAAVQSISDNANAPTLATLQKAMND